MFDVTGDKKKFYLAATPRRNPGPFYEMYENALDVQDQPYPFMKIFGIWEEQLAELEKTGMTRDEAEQLLEVCEGNLERAKVFAALRVSFPAKVRPEVADMLTQAAAPLPARPAPVDPATLNRKGRRLRRA